MRTVATFLMIIIATALSIGAARAADETIISIAPPSMAISGTAIASSVIILPNEGTPLVALSFVLPTNYPQNRPLKVRFYLYSSTSCTASFKLTALNRKRLGQPAYPSPPPVDGAVMAGGETVTFSGATVTAIKSLTITKPLSGPFPHMRAGDLIFVGVSRSASDPADTCSGDILLEGAEVRYVLPPD